MSQDETQPRRADIKPYTIVFEHGDGNTDMFVAMASNHDIHIRMGYSDNPAEFDHVMTMTEFDQFVEQVHAYHAEVPNVPAGQE